MTFDDLYVGQKVSIICWEDEMGEDEDPYDYRPEHWCEDGGMDDWQGETVTIDKLGNEKSGYVYIKEDAEEHNGHWQWYPWDFNWSCNLPNHNPNKVYQRVASQKKYDAFRKSRELEKTKGYGYK